MRTAVILTALPVETEHVLSHLEETKRDHRAEQTFRIGKFKDRHGQPWRIVVAEERGTVQAAVNTALAVMAYKPEVILFVGVAGGIKDAAIGDAVVSTKVYGYEDGKVTASSFLARPQAYQPDHGLLSLARDMAREDGWKRRCAYRKPKDGRRVYFGAIASGSKVIVSDKADLVTFLSEHYNDTLAVETEGHGFAAAADMVGRVPWLVIRGVSDHLTGKSESDAQGNQEYAVDNAAALAFHLLYEYTADTQGSIGGDEPPEPADPVGRQQGWSRKLGRSPVFSLTLPELKETVPMAVIPPGVFIMGSLDRPEEFPPQRITLQRPFAISCTAVPVSLFSRWRTSATPAHPDMPVVGVDWQTANDFTAWLSQIAGARIRLPSEAELECAIRAGNEGDFWCGAQPRPDFNIALKGEAARSRRIQTADSGAPNPWGLHHAHGNVWEWVADGWRSNLHGQPENGAAWTADPTERVIKGGSYRDTADKARSASRDRRSPSHCGDTIGFRIAMDFPPRTACD